MRRKGKGNGRRKAKEKGMGMEEGRHKRYFPTNFHGYILAKKK